jgi:hypothetical protein
MSCTGHGEDGDNPNARYGGQRLENVRKAVLAMREDEGSSTLHGDGPASANSQILPTYLRLHCADQELSSVAASEARAADLQLQGPVWRGCVVSSGYWLLPRHGSLSSLYSRYLASQPAFSVPTHRWLAGFSALSFDTSKLPDASFPPPRWSAGLFAAFCAEVPV